VSSQHSSKDADRADSTHQGASWYDPSSFLSFGHVRDVGGVQPRVPPNLTVLKQCLCVISRPAV
jgi:hypothetical protein